jgi:chitin disaccharide deacetylase
MDMARNDFSRRNALKLGLSAAAAGLWRIAGAADPAMAAAGAEEPGPPTRFLIVNADDLGLSNGVNRGIIEAHVRGIVTSASLLVNGAGAEAAARLAHEHPGLSVGFHADLSGPRFDGAPDTLSAAGDELERQFETFQRLMGRLPTHIDSHHHVHLRHNLAHLFVELGERNGLPVRGLSPVTFIGAFYGQWPVGRSAVARVSPSALIALLDGIGPGLYALGCHPGYAEANVEDIYGPEREIELRTLTDARVRAAVRRCRISLVNFHQYRRLVAATTTRRMGSRKAR